MGTKSIFELLLDLNKGNQYRAGLNNCYSTEISNIDVYSNNLIEGNRW